MYINRNHISAVADIVRDRLGLQAPIALDTLRDVITQKLPGRCISMTEDRLDADAQIRTLDKTSFEIRYLDDRPATRTLFSISHELGHLFLHLLKEDGTLRQAVCNRDLAQNHQEAEANEFAAVFLMPEEEFISKCHEHAHEDKINVTKVAEYFNVSVRAATVRGSVLGLWR